MPLPPDDEGVLTRVKATLAAGSDPEETARLAGELFYEDYDLWFRFMDIILEQNRRSQAGQQIFFACADADLLHDGRLWRLRRYIRHRLFAAH